MLRANLKIKGFKTMFHFCYSTIKITVVLKKLYAITLKMNASIQMILVPESNFTELPKQEKLHSFKYARIFIALCVKMDYFYGIMKLFH